MWQSIMKLIVIWIKEILILIFLLWLLAYIEWLDNSFAMNNGSFCLAYCNIMQIDQVQQQYKLCYSFSLHWACAETENVKFRDERIRLLWDTNFLTALPLKAYAEAGWLVRFSTFSQNSMVCKFCLPFVVQAELSSCFQHQSAKLVQLTYKHNESYTSLMAPNTDCKSEHTCVSVNISAELTLSCLPAWLLKSVFMFSSEKTQMATWRIVEVYKNIGRRERIDLSVLPEEIWFCTISKDPSRNE